MRAKRTFGSGRPLRVRKVTMLVSFKICWLALTAMIASLVATEAQGQSVASTEKIVVATRANPSPTFPF